MPVGEDQKQHLELTRDIAQKFNNDFGVEFFPIVEPLIFGGATRVMSLRNGSKKMSKSDPSDQSRITFTDTADDISKKIRRAKTDPEELPSEMEGLKERPEALNLIGIYAALSGQTSADVLREFGGRGFGDFKPALSDLAIEKLVPISDKMRQLMADPGHIDAILADGAERARVLADPILREVHEIVGLISS